MMKFDIFFPFFSFSLGWVGGGATGGREGEKKDGPSQFPSSASRACPLD